MSKKVLLVVLFLGALLMLALSIGRAHAQATSVTLDWTASGDDSTAGTATSVMFFYSAATPDTTGYAAWLAGGGMANTTPAGIQAWVNNATNVTVPAASILPGGSASSFAVPGSFAAGVKYWFMLRTCDEVATNPCARSNFATKTIAVNDVWPPRAVRDLRSR